MSLRAAHAQGAWVTTTDGARHADWIMGHGTLLLGHRHPEVEAAVAAQLARGTLFPCAAKVEDQVRAALQAAWPGAEGVAFGKNGSDVCTAAVRLARAATGRSGVLSYGYHGFHDWSAALDPKVAGLPAGLREQVYAIPYDDLDALGAILRAEGARIAAVMVEPLRDRLPGDGYLPGVARLCREHGVVLVFDEMVTGFRLGNGGAQARFCVRPDLTCLGKALTNGLPLAALVGRRELLTRLPSIGYGMTMRGEALALAAARASLAVYAREPVAQSAAAAGAAVRDGFARLCAERGVEAALRGDPAMLTFALPDGWQAPFIDGCRRRGVLHRGHLLPSAAHDDEVVAHTLAACAAALDDCLRQVPR